MQGNLLPFAGFMAHYIIFFINFVSNFELWKIPLQIPWPSL